MVVMFARWINGVVVEGQGTFPGGVLRYIGDGEVRSPFLGLKLAILDFF